VGQTWLKGFNKQFRLNRDLRSGNMQAILVIYKCLVLKNLRCTASSRGGVFILRKISEGGEGLGAKSELAKSKKKVQQGGLSLTTKEDEYKM